MFPKTSSAEILLSVLAQSCGVGGKFSGHLDDKLFCISLSTRK